MSESKISKHEKTIKLEFPIDFDGESISEVKLKRPKGKHLKKLPAEPGVKDLLAIASRVSGLPAIIFDEMDGSDVSLVCEAIGDFLAPGQ